MTTEERLKQLHPIVADTVAKVLAKLADAKIAALLFSGFRSFEEQDKLYALGRTIPNRDGLTAAKPLGNIITKAQSGDSWHNYGLAVDLVRVDAKGNPTWDLPFSDIGRIGKECGMEWGGDWLAKDLPHLEIRFGYTISQAKAIVKEKGLPHFWEIITAKQWP